MALGIFIPVITYFWNERKIYPGIETNNQSVVYVLFLSQPMALRRF